MGIDVSTIIALIAVAISIISFLVNQRHYQHPILIFYLEDDKSWCVKNVGNGTAINIDLMAGNEKKERDPEIVLRLPALTCGDKHRISGFHCGHAYAVVYRDIFKRTYTTEVWENANKIERHNMFPDLVPTKFIWQ
jgi:hypothetical protein